jgi:hypothetical protein
MVIDKTRIKSIITTERGNAFITENSNKRSIEIKIRNDENRFARNTNLISAVIELFLLYNPKRLFINSLIDKEKNNNNTNEDRYSFKESILWVLIIKDKNAEIMNRTQSATRICQSSFFFSISWFLIVLY